jgi:large subunit ribosomal protein L24
MAGRCKVKKNDQVVVLSGRDKGKRGRVIEVLTKKGKVMVEGINIIKKHVRPNRSRGIAGGIAEREAPIAISKVMVLEPSTRKPTRIGYQLLQDGRKVRVSRKTNAVLE